MVEYILLAASIGLNAFLLWYTGKLLSNLLYMSNNLNDLYEEVLSFRDHLNKVYGLEMFYGDETLKAMLRHAKHLAALFDDYESILLLTQAEEDLEEDDDGDTEET
tara:strand:+ start:72 stop:389 length:318 start_codon:yes stop_codon:yes gene_type:complete